MNNSIKALIGLATTGTAVAGAFLANNLLNKGQEKKVESKSESVRVDWAKRNSSRVGALTKLFKDANDSVRGEMSDIITGRVNNPIFLINNNGRFYNDGDVATAIHAWCSGYRDGEEEKLKKRQELKKTEICEL